MATSKNFMIFWLFVYELDVKLNRFSNNWKINGSSLNLGISEDCSFIKNCTERHFGADKSIYNWSEQEGVKGQSC